MGIKEKVMKKKDQYQLLKAWNEIEEVSCDLRDLSDTELIECRKVMEERTDKALGIISDFIDEDVFQNEIIL